MGLNSENAVVMAQQKPYFIFDIETCPMPNCADYLTDPIEAPANYKDPAKIATWVENKRLQQVNEAALDIDLCEVAAIGWESGGGTTSGHATLTRKQATETQLLELFWDAFCHDAIGFNITHFDLLVLLRRSLYLGIRTPPISVDRYRHDGIVDLADLLSFGRRDLLRSLGFYARRLGIPHDDTVKGSDIPLLVANGDWDTVAKHVRDDVQTTKAIAERLGVIQVAAIAEVL